MEQSPSATVVKDFFVRRGKAVVYLCVIVLILFSLGRHLNPFSGYMFDFHDETQAARISQFALNLQHGNIPPKLAPHFSFNLGFPVFNFYAPTAYWISAMIYLLGFSIAATLKMSFLLSLVLAFVCMFLILRELFSFFSALVGAIFYITSTYFAVEIFIRGNLAETWFLALFPLALYMVYINAKKNTPILFFFTTIVLFALFTVHNIMSLLAVPLVGVFAFLISGNVKKNMIAVVIGLFMSSYFFLPALTEMSLTYAKEQATFFYYKDHFLCLWQLWTSPTWGFGGSLPGCDADLMSFKLGKEHMLISLSGIVFFIWHLARKGNIKHYQERDRVMLFILVLSLVSLFMTLYQSQFLWTVFEPILSLFQFPWRFLVFGMVGIAFFSAYFFQHIMRSKIGYVEIVIMIVVVGMLFRNQSYFAKPLMTESVFEERYHNSTYIHKLVAYNIREYVPKTVDYGYWHSLNVLEVHAQEVPFDYADVIDTVSDYEVVKNDPFEKEVLLKEKGELYVNIHYFPFWHIFIHGEKIEVDQFDRLGRPLLRGNEGDVIRIVYGQTPIEQVANGMTVVSFGVLVFLTVRQRLMEKKLQTKDISSQKKVGH